MSRKLTLKDKNTYLNMTEEELKDLWIAYYPSGSGPLSTMRQICVLIETVARMRNFDVDKWVEVVL